MRTAERAEEARTVLQGFHPRLILMDIQLPGTNGLELTRQLRSDPSFQDVVIVAVTASAMKADEQKAMEAGCDGYIAKPPDTRTLQDLVRGYLNRSANAMPPSMSRPAAATSPTGYHD